MTTATDPDVVAAPATKPPASLWAMALSGGGGTYDDDLPRNGGPGARGTSG